jgi:hypothetical protein
MNSSHRLALCTGLLFPVPILAETLIRCPDAAALVAAAAPPARPAGPRATFDAALRDGRLGQASATLAAATPAPLDATGTLNRTAPGSAQTAAAAKTKPPPRPASVTLAAAPPPPPPLPTWTARSGEYFTDVLRRWGREARYTVLIETAEDWRLAVPVNATGELADVLREIVEGLGGRQGGPKVRIHPNKVIRVGGRS